MGEQVPYTAAEDLVIIDEENADPVLIGLGAEAAPTSHRLDGLPPPLSPTTWV
jgi:hypothetical protein